MKTNVLIVSDDTDQIKQIGLFLTKKKFNVLVATSQKQAVLIANKKTPDIILFDLSHTSLKYFFIIDTLKKDKKSSHIKFLFFGNKPEKKLEAKINQTSGCYCLLPPFSLDSLLIKLNSAIKLPTEQKTNKRFTVMVVDDIEVNRNLIEDILVDSNYKIIKSSSGKDSLKKIKENKIDLILLDIEMPGMDGWKTIDTYKALKIKVPVFSLSAHTDKKFYAKCKEFGFKQVVSKPINTTSLLSLINQTFINTNTKSIVTKPFTASKKSFPFIDVSKLMQVSSNDLKLRKSTYLKFLSLINKVQLKLSSQKELYQNNEILRKDLHSFVNLTPYFCKTTIVKKVKQLEQDLKNGSDLKKTNFKETIAFLKELKSQVTKIKYSGL